jgi:hypothetical protein
MSSSDIQVEHAENKKLVLENANRRDEVCEQYGAVSGDHILDDYYECEYCYKPKIIGVYEGKLWAKVYDHTCEHKSSLVITYNGRPDVLYNMYKNSVTSERKHPYSLKLQTIRRIVDNPEKYPMEKLSQDLFIIIQGLLQAKIERKQKFFP